MDLTIKYCNILWGEGLEKWLSGEEHWQFIQRTQVLSQHTDVTVTSVPENPPLFWPLQTLHAHGAQTCMQTNTHTHNNINESFFKKKEHSENLLGAVTL